MVIGQVGVLQAKVNKRSLSVLNCNRIDPSEKVATLSHESDGSKYDGFVTLASRFFRFLKAFFFALVPYELFSLFRMFLRGSFDIYLISHCSFVSERPN